MARERVENANKNVEEAPKSSTQNNMLNQFTQLTHTKSQVRVKAALKLIENALSSSSKITVDNTEFRYTLTRLVRGVASSKLTSQTGYFLALSVLLECLPPDGQLLSEIIAIMEKELQTSKQNSKSENSSILSGIVLVCGAILGCGKYCSLDSANQRIIVERLQSASSKKTYLSLLSSELIVDALNKQIDSQSFSTSFLPHLHASLKKPLDEYKINDLYVLLILHDHFPKVVSSKFLKQTIGNGAIIDKATHESIVAIIMHVVPQKNCQAHPIYAELGRIVAQHPDDVVFGDFMQQLDDDFSSPTPTKHLLYATFLRHIIAALVDGNRVALCIRTHFLTNSIAYFNRVSAHRQSDDIITALRATFDVLAACAQRPEVATGTQLGLIRQLLFDDGNFLIEKITGTKLIQQLTATLDESGVRQLSALYMDVVQTAGSDYVTTKRVYAAQMLSKLLSHPVLRAPTHNAWKNEQLCVLMHLGCMHQTAISAELAKSLKDTFFRALDARLSKLKYLRARLTYLVHSVDEDKGRLNVPLTNDQLTLWTRTMQRINRLDSRQQQLAPVFHTLFSYMLLQLLNDADLAGDALNELHACYARKRHANDNDLPWIQVIIDLFLHLLSHNSNATRKIIGCVFPHLCEHLTDDALEQIMLVLEPNAENPLVNDEDSESDVDDEEESTGDERGSESESCSESNSSGDEYAADESQLDKLRQAVQVVLTTGESSDMESVDLDSMSDEAAMKLDTALGEAFAHHRPKNGRQPKKQQLMDEALMYFRVRVMDLIDIYIASEPSMETCIKLILPLLGVMEFAVRSRHQQPLKVRVESALAKLASTKHFQSDEEQQQQHLTMTHLVDTMETILSKGEKSALMMSDLAETIADCCMFIVHISSKLRDCTNAAPLIDLVMRKLDDFIVKRDCLTPFAFFKKLMKSSWEHIAVLVAPLFDVVFAESIRNFRRRQALELLLFFYSNRRALSAHACVYADALGNSEMDFLNDVNTFLHTQQHTLNQSTLADLFYLLCDMKQFGLTLSADCWTPMKSLLPNYRAGVILNNSTKAAYNKLCRMLNIQAKVVTKSNAVKLNGLRSEDEDAAKEDAAKKRKSNAAKKLKKEARSLRMQSLSEGIGHVSFANATRLLHLDTDATSSNCDVPQEATQKRKINANTSQPKKRKTKK